MNSLLFSNFNFGTFNFCICKEKHLWKAIVKSNCEKHLWIKGGVFLFLVLGSIVMVMIASIVMVMISTNTYHGNDCLE